MCGTNISGNKTINTKRKGLTGEYLARGRGSKKRPRANLPQDGPHARLVVVSISVLYRFVEPTDVAFIWKRHWQITSRQSKRH